MILNRYRCTAEECLSITDTLGDIVEANVLDIPTIAILDGFHKFETLKKGKPLAIIKSLKEIFTYSCTLK